jgi:hypothetical protein
MQVVVDGVSIGDVFPVSMCSGDVGVVVAGILSHGDPGKFVYRAVTRSAYKTDGIDVAVGLPDEPVDRP